MMAALEAARDALAAVPGLADFDGGKSCKVGLESGISPAQYPLIRVVPVRATPGRPYNQRTVEALVYFAAQIAQSQGLETVLAGLFDMEKAILDIGKAQGWRYLETIAAPNPFEAPQAYQVMGIRFELPSAVTAPA